MAATSFLPAEAVVPSRKRLFRIRHFPWLSLYPGFITGQAGGIDGKS
jgi:hypothetical protein